MIKDTVNKVGEQVCIQGWVQIRRDHGKLIFLDIADRSAMAQIVVNMRVTQDAYKVAQQIRPQYAVQIIGTVLARPDNAVKADLITGTIEIEAKEIKVLAEAEVLPFDMGQPQLNLELPTLFDYRSLTLRHPKIVQIFKLQESVVDYFRKAAEKLDCVEIFIPTIAASATEGGAEVFTVDYYGHPAFLTQSPQLYKQIMVGVFERVYTIAHAYRAEPSVTTRHLAETVQMDCEIAFVNNFSELLDALEFVAKHMISQTAEKHKDIIHSFAVDMPFIPKEIPRLKLREAQEIIYKRTGRDVRKELDLSPEDEKEIWLWAKEEKGSDLVTITHFPTKKRAFYTMPDPQDPEFSLSYDLIFRGIEILSGSQRINNYDDLLRAVKEKHVDPAGFTMYLQAFKYGIPPEGGFSFGLERITMKMLNLANVREASAFPRDMERVDERLKSVKKEIQK